jgi:hypothetical protein
MTNRRPPSNLRRIRHQARCTGYSFAQMPPMNQDMDHVTLLPIVIPSDEELAEAMLHRLAERQRIRQVAAELAPRVERALGLRRRGTS